MAKQPIVRGKLILFTFFFLSSLIYSQTAPPDSITTLSTSAATATAVMIDYQGFLSTAQGQPISGTATITFSLWDAQDAGNLLWQETQVLDVHLGYFTAHLGTVATLSPALFTGLPRWLQVAVNGEMLTPRKHVNSVPSAVFSENAAALGGIPAANFYSKSQAESFQNNKIDASSLGGVPATGYVTFTQGDVKYLIKGSLNSVSSDMIIDGSIQRKDLGFDPGSSSSAISKIVADSGLEGGGSSGEVHLSLNAGYLSGQVYDVRFVKRGEANGVNGAMVADGSLTSDDIKDGGIQTRDLAFTAGTINQVIAGEGLAGGGSIGAVTLALNDSYKSGSAYDARFVKRNDLNVVSSAMIRDGEITSADIRDGSLQPQDMAFAAGDVTAVVAGNGMEGGGVYGDLKLGLDANYVSGAAFDTRFVKRNEPSSINSAMIINNSIQAEDLAFPAGDISSVITSTGITGGGTSGDVHLQLESAYSSGSAYNSVFVNENQVDGVTSSMIRDGEVRGTDIANNAIVGAHLENAFAVQQNQPDRAVFSALNQSTSLNSRGIEGRGYEGVRGIGSSTGVYGEGSQYGVYARASNPANWGLYVDGKAHCTSGAWGDLAEFVQSTESLQAGDVVIIDERGKSSFKRCDRENDVRVAGIISTEPTITVGENKIGQDKYPLALAGIVPCKVYANQPIVPGDLLTTSAEPGFAQKAVQPTLGAIVGKALEPLSHGKGIIRVLVTLR